MNKGSAVKRDKILCQECNVRIVPDRDEDCAWCPTCKNAVDCHHHGKMGECYCTGEYNACCKCS